MARSNIIIRKPTVGAPSVFVSPSAVVGALGVGASAPVAASRRVPSGIAASAALGTLGVGGSGVSTNPITVARRVDWTYAGATIVNRTTRSGSIIQPYNGSSATIQNALAAAPANTYVELGAGTFNLTNALNLGQKNNVTLRGQGMSTILNFTGLSGANWYWAGGSCVVTMSGSFANASDASPTTASVPSGQTRAWTGCGGVAGSYPRGATTLNLASAPTGLAVGDIVTLWQSNEPNASIPHAGFFVSSKTGSSGAVSWEGTYDDHGQSLMQRSVVTAVSGSTVTIDTPLLHDLFSAARGPQVSWHKASQFVSGIGLEYLRIVTTSLGQHQTDIGIAHAKDCWIKGVGLVPKFTSFHAKGACDYGIVVQDSHRVEVRDSWIHTMRGGGPNTTTSYGVSTKASSCVKVENNIFYNPESPIVPNIGTMGSVFSYNLEVYVGDDQQESGFQPHEPGQVYNLFEGNSFRKFWGDLFHGNSMLLTLYRNHMYGYGMSLDSYYRFFNSLGNTIQASTVRKTVVTDATKRSRFGGYAYRLGYPSEQATSSTTQGVAADPDVSSTMLIWGDYTTIGDTQFNSSEVPSSDLFFPNPVPSSQALPASQLYETAPAFLRVGSLGTVPFPAIGPDVTGGAFMGGRAHKIPAQLMVEAASDNIANFDPHKYGAYYSSFTATENPISEGGVWVNGGTHGGLWQDCQSANGNVFATGLNPGTFDDSLAHISADVYPFGPNQEVIGVVHRASGYNPSAIHEIEILLRFAISNGVARGYEINWAINGDYIQLIRWNGPLSDFTYLDTNGTSSGVVLADGDVIRGRIVGNTITLYRNGVLIFTGTDSTFSDGQPGIGFYRTSGSTAANYGWQSIEARQL